MGIINVNLDVIDKLLIIYFAFVKYIRKNRNTMRRCILIDLVNCVAKCISTFHKY